MVMAGVDGAPAPPALMVERVERRNRLTVAFRLLLALPQFSVVYVAGAGRHCRRGGRLVPRAGVGAAARADHPVPVPSHPVHHQGLRLPLFLTDRYPPFEFAAADYPVQVELAPGRLNRLAVLFRLLLVIPAWILSSLAFGGYVVASFVIWLVVLVAGRVPTSLFAATTAVLRYNLRMTAYTWLITAAYPWGLFGDQPGPPGPPGPAVSPEPEGAPGEALPGTTTLASPPVGDEPPRPPRGLLVLSAAAKGLVVLFLVLGVGQYVASGVVSSIMTSNADRTAQATSELTAAHNTLAGHVQQYQQQTAACSAELSCFQSADRELADAFAAFATELRRIEFPAAAQAEAATLGDLADRIASSLQEQAAAGSPEEYQRLATDNQELGNTFDQQEQTLVSSLSA